MTESTSDYGNLGGAASSGAPNDGGGCAPAGGTAGAVAASVARGAVKHTIATASRVRTMAEEGPLSFKVMAFLAGILMIATSVLDFLNGLLHINPTHVVVAAYVCGSAFVMIILEGRGFIPEIVIKKFQDPIHDNAKFLRYVSGRGAFYFFAGLLQFGHWSFLNMISGGVVMFIGSLFVVVGRSTAPKLGELRAAIGDESHLQVLFVENDRDKDGFMTVEDFEGLVGTLDLNFSRNECLAAFDAMDGDDKGKVSYDDFKVWWGGAEVAVVGRSLV
uniref:EF-hand domain-containing protein n=1 Tax=Trieres chinensis TaxID=1514140 RepID=A0A7S1YV34_TRICV|mmetsp:Transcript_1122/g.2394  ORF Transcript_1122/g.2394 Transcript_1122/m.2394 type:complete len:275 (+) Transcript_1122:117-941(+)|eukprot:CAMPEP_0183301370 /NCGR_PEP_ID=MMETSP0160_2-20130417/7516_1 /TAXON_ID=2839 ORGANISM="Odontella Sinensis, Strain Grunow 1884" /NCGR_SAMPLE_ID=MMETSP0160_2 /ASSEMBLY_ACC=CAM_ASM_000250 /LENGTH=274 /DNA_ID=CAMNT_0025463979 /DNA_START=62 /DNA_END=886 /DNA_ORIENTATION=+